MSKASFVDTEIHMRRLIVFGRDGHSGQRRKQLAAKPLAFVVSGMLMITGGFVGGSVRPAAALPVGSFARAFPGAIVKVACKYGTSHCVNPYPGPSRPKVGGAKFPDNGWTGSDCKYYGNCNTGTSPQNWGDPTISRRGPTGTRGHSGVMRPVHFGSSKTR